MCIARRLMVIFSLIFSAHSYAMEIKHELGSQHFDTPPKKIVALDWSLAETVLSLGLPLEGVADARGYRQWVEKPRLTSSVIDVGSRREPNLELLTRLKPDVILISQSMASAYLRLNKIAPVLVYSIYNKNKHPLLAAKNVTRSLGKLFAKPDQAERVIQQTNHHLTVNGQKLKAQHIDPALLFVRFISDKTLRIHGQGSLAQATIAKMGLHNAWQASTNFWGFSTVGIEKLAEHQNAELMMFGPQSPSLQRQLNQSPLWQAMAFYRHHQLYALAPIWTFGGLIAAQRFSDHITQELIAHHAN
ncbi:MAG: iron-siderophore ABC transporter substrate-binding protein [Vibrio sp.]